ncbi:MAG: tetratricopeptide repeat protein [Phycisphaerae bacterium]|nr:tetratricopeptide repeat protein [Phycisphaerae bacterium]
MSRKTSDIPKPSVATRGPASSVGNLPATANSPAVRIGGIVALATAMTLAVLLGVRPMESEDLGYHLAYGEHFLDTGEVFNHSPYIYTLANRQTQPGPGGWYDGDGKFQFVSANWGTQIVMAAVYRVGGMTGLCILQAALVAGMFVLILLIYRAMKVPPLWMAGAILLTAMATYERFSLRPELLTYVILLGQLYVLLPAYLGEAKFAAWRIVVLCVLQVLLVNVHSYFLLGLGFTGVAFGDRLVRLIWNRFVGGSAQAGSQRSCSVRLGVVLLAQAGLCFLNPWTWRLVVMPFETLWYIKVNRIDQPPISGQVGHPLSMIAEFFPAFLPGAWMHSKATYAFIVVLVIAAIGVLAALFRRRWGMAVLITVMAASVFSMRRNIVVASLVLVPLAVYCIYALLCKLTPPTARLGKVAAGVAAILITATAGWFSVSVVRSQFYYEERRATRFGVGVSDLRIPLGAAGWINRHKPAGRLWCDYSCSSNVYYFTQPHRDVPIITNTWAWPHDVMAEVLDYSLGRNKFEQACKDYQLQIVVLRVDSVSTTLALSLSADPAWAIVFLDSRYAVFLHLRGPNAALARQHGLDPSTFDVAKHIEAIRRQDPLPAYAFHDAGMTLQRIGWDTQAIELFRAAVDEDPECCHAWFELGFCYALRSQSYRNKTNCPQAMADLTKALRCMEKCLEIKPDHERAIEFRQVIQKDISALRMLGG